MFRAFSRACACRASRARTPARLLSRTLPCRHSRRLLALPATPSSAAPVTAPLTPSRCVAEICFALLSKTFQAPNPNPCARPQDTTAAPDAAAYAFFAGASDTALDGELGGLDENDEEEVAGGLAEDELDIEAERCESSESAQREDEDLSCTSPLYGYLTVALTLTRALSIFLPTSQSRRCLHARRLWEALVLRPCPWRRLPAPCTCLARRCLALSDALGAHHLRRCRHRRRRVSTGARYWQLPRLPRRSRRSLWPLQPPRRCRGRRLNRRR